MSAPQSRQRKGMPFALAATTVFLALVATAGTATAKVYRLPGGGTLTVPRAALSPGAKVIARRADRRRLPGHARSLGRPVSLRVAHGRLVAPVQLRFPYRERIDPLGMPLDLSVQIAYFDARARQWKTVPAHVNRIRRTVTATITAPIWNEANLIVDAKGARAAAAGGGSSWWNPLSWDWASLAARLDQRVGEVRGARTGPAHCTTGTRVPAWAVVTVSNTTDNPLRTCAEGQGDNVVVQIVNNRPYGVILKYGAPVAWGWHEQPGESDKAAGAMLADALVSPSELYIAPLKAASVGVPRGAWRAAHFQASITRKSLAADVLAFAVDKLDAKLIRPAMVGELAAKCSWLLKPHLDGAVPINSDVLDNVAGVAQCLVKAVPSLRAKGLLTGAASDRLEHALTVFAKVGLAAQTAKIAGHLADLYVGSRPELQDLASFDLFRQGADDPSPAPALPPSAPGQPPSAPGAPPPATPHTWPEQQGSHGANTFTNPYNASGQGQKIAAYMWVEVACKLYAPQITSANPDGYWYRIASPPWSGTYYAVANTFWNGDVPGQLPYTHNTDWAIPDC